MVEIPIYEYTCKTPRGDLAVSTFRQGGRRLVTLLAPDGSELRHRDGTPPKLKVPMAGRTLEFHLLTASEALEAARAGRCGLAPAPSREGAGR